MKALRAWRDGCLSIVLHCVLFLSACSGSASAAPSSAPASAHSLEFVTEEFPPFNFDNNGHVEGLGPDVVREMLRREHLSAPMAVLPWPRAYLMAQKEANVGIYSLARSAEREKLFQWVGPIANLDSRIYMMRDSPLHINTIADAKNANHVIVLREGYNAHRLEKLGFTNLAMVNSPAEGLRLLLLGGGKSLIVTSPESIVEALHGTSIPADRIKEVFALPKSQLYIGFSRDTPIDFVSRLQQTLYAMKSDGSFAAIYQKWLPGENPPGLEPEPEISPASR